MATAKPQRHDQLSVVHVVPRDVARGAQIYANELRRRLDGRSGRHRLVLLFRGGAGVLEPDVALDVPESRLRAAGYDPRVAWRLRRALRRARPDVVVTHGGESLLYAVPALPRGCALVHYRIGIATADVHSGLRRQVHRLSFRRATVVAGVSQETLDEAAEVFDVPRERLVLIPNGRDPDRYRPAHRRVDPVRPVVTFVGHLTASKRPDWFVDVVEEVRERGHDIAARIIGDGPLMAELRPRCDAGGVELLGRRDDVHELLADTDVFCFTSRPEGEGLPGVLIEAALSGVPIVTTDVPGARTVVDDGTTGFVVHPDDRDGFVHAVVGLVSDPALRTRAATAARERAVRTLSFESSTRRWEELLAGLPARRRARRSG